MGKIPDQYYRAGVGAVIVRGDEVLLFERTRIPGNWQFPQGGLDPGEEPEDAVLREVEEETGLTAAQLRPLGRHPDVLTYELPPEYRSKRMGRGQCQTWFFFAFDGEDSAIDISQTDEFQAYRWMTMSEAVDQVVPFRTRVYRNLEERLRELDTAPPAELGPVSLREITTKDELRAVLRLSTTRLQRRFVAPNGASVAQSMFEPRSWLRAIYAGDTAVGLVLLYDHPEWGLDRDPQVFLEDGSTPKPEYYLWRLLIGAKYQGRGFGKAAVEQVIDYVRTRPNAAELVLSYVPGEGNPRGFYEGFGFEDTGEVDEGEIVMRLKL